MTIDLHRRPHLHRRRGPRPRATGRQGPLRRRWHRTAVVHAVAAYRNDDGGFGHGLEPDKLAPVQPAPRRGGGARTAGDRRRLGPRPRDRRVRLPRHGLRGRRGADRVRRRSTTTRTPCTGAEIPLVAGQNPTASIAGYAHALGVRHPWVDEATEWSFRSLGGRRPARRRCTRCAASPACSSTPPTGLGRSRAPRPRSPRRCRARRCTRSGRRRASTASARWSSRRRPPACARPWFADDVIEANLDHLERHAAGRRRLADRLGAPRASAALAPGAAWSPSRPSRS